MQVAAQAAANLAAVDDRGYLVRGSQAGHTGVDRLDSLVDTPWSSRRCAEP